MADPSTIDAAFQRTYELRVDALDLMGDPPHSDDAPVQAVVELVRVDGQQGNPLFGPAGLIFDTVLSETFSPAASLASDSAIRAGRLTFELIPNGYWFVPTRYVLTLAGRVYEFVMPAQDTTLVALLEAEAAPSAPGDGGDDGGDDGGSTTPARALPAVTSVADATALSNAQSDTEHGPLLARVTADFGMWETGDLIIWTGETDGWVLLVRTHTNTVRSRGTLRAWWQVVADPLVISVAVDAVEADIHSDRTVVHLTRAAPGNSDPDRAVVVVALPAALDDDLTLIGNGMSWAGLLTKTASLTHGAETLTAYHAEVDVSQGADIVFEAAL